MKKENFRKLVGFFFPLLCHSFFFFFFLVLLNGFAPRRRGERTLWSYMTKPQWLGQGRSGQGLGGPARQDYRTIPLLAFILCLSSLLGIEHVEWLLASDFLDDESCLWVSLSSETFRWPRSCISLFSCLLHLNLLSGQLQRFENRINRTAHWLFEHA